LKFNFRLYVLVALIIISSWYLFSPLFFKKAGVVVVGLDEDSKCGDIKLGDYITYVSGRNIKNELDFENVLKTVKKGERVAMVVGWGPGGCTAIGDGDVGIEVADVPSKSLKFGLDVYGGKRAWLVVDVKLDELKHIKNIIEKRSKVFGTSQIKVDIESGHLFVDALNVNDLPFLISKGVLEGLIEQQLKLSGGVTQIKIGSDYYDIKPLNSSNSASVIVEDSEYTIGDNFVIGNISFKLLNITNDSVIVSGLVFTNEDVGPARAASSYIKYAGSTREYQYFVPVELSESASNAFSRITDGMPSVYVGQGSILEGLLVFYIDGEEINRLSIPVNMAGQNVKSLSIIGAALDANEATIKKKSIEMAMVGSIDHTISMGEIVEYKAGGVWLLYVLVGCVCFLSIVLFIISYALYKGHKNLKVSSWSVFTLLSVVFPVFGIASMSQSIFAPGWILDSVSILGIISLVVWEFFWIILITEKTLKRRDIKIKKHLNIILLVSSFILLFTKFSGFGIAMISGVILNFLVAGPLYRKILH